MHKRWAFLVTAVLFCLYALTGCSDPDAQRILFVGNSYTHQNDLPKMFGQLAKSGGHSVVTDTFAPAGWYLSDHAASTDLPQKIEKGNYHVVVLQEQSVLPATTQRGAEMYPAARALHQSISASGAETMFFLTWARQEGTAVQEIGFSTFNDMQTQLTAGYQQIANELGAPVAPVGPAWQRALAERPDIPLYANDGSHPSKQGTYLAAAVFYAVLFNESPEGLAYVAGLAPEDATFLQRMAAETVLAPVR